jgi:prepilin peptidase CpaA
MSGQTLTALPIAILALLLVIAAYGDLRTRLIPNWLTGSIALLAPVSWVMSDMTLWPGVALQFGIAAAVFALFLIAFALRAMGGGDVKLIAALGLWFSLVPMIQILAYMSIIGGALTVGMMLWHKIKKIETALEVPYGVAISIAALGVLAERNLNHFG